MTVSILKDSVFNEHLGMIQFYCDSENVIDFSYIFETDTREIEFSFISSDQTVIIKYTLDTNILDDADALEISLTREDLDKRILCKVPVGEHVEIREMYKEIFPSDYTPTIGGNLYRNFTQDKYVTKNTYDNFICSRDIEGHFLDDLGRVQRSYAGQKKVIKSLHLIVPSLVKRSGTENYYYSSTELNEDEKITWFAVSGKYVYDLYDLDNNLIRSDLTEVTPYVSIVNSNGNRAESVPGILNVPEGESFNNTYYGYLYYETLNGDFDYVKSDNCIILEKFKVAKQEPLEGELSYEEGGIPLYIVGPYAGNYTKFNVSIDSTFSPDDLYLKTGNSGFSKIEIKNYEGEENNINTLLNMAGCWTHDNIPDDLNVEPGGIFYITSGGTQHYFQYCSGWVNMPWYIRSSTVYDPEQLFSNHNPYPGACLTNKVGARTYRKQYLFTTGENNSQSWKWVAASSVRPNLTVMDGEEDSFPMGKIGNEVYTYYSPANKIVRKIAVFNASQSSDAITGDYINNVEEKYPWESFSNPIENVTIGCSDIFRKYFSFSAELSEEGLENGTVTVTITALEDNNETNPWRPSYANVHPVLNVSTITVRESGKQGSIPVATISFYVVQKSSKIGIIPVEYLNESSSSGKDLEYDYTANAFILPVEGTIGVKTKFIGLRSEVDPYDEIVRSWRITEAWDNGTRSYFFKSYSGEFSEKIVLYTSAVNEDLPIFKVSDFINRSSLWRRAIYESVVSILPRVSSEPVIDIDNGLTKYEVDAPTPFFINTNRLFLFKETENRIAKKFHLNFTRTGLAIPEGSLEILINGRNLSPESGEYTNSEDSTTGLKYSLFVDTAGMLGELYGSSYPTVESGWYLDYEGKKILEVGGRELVSLLKISTGSGNSEKRVYIYYSGFKRIDEYRAVAEMGVLINKNTSFSQGLSLLPTSNPLVLSFRLGDSEDQLVSYYIGTEKVGKLKLFDETNSYYVPSDDLDATTTIRIPEISKYHVTSVYDDPVMKGWELLLPNDKIFSYEIVNGNEIIEEPAPNETALVFDQSKSHFSVTADEDSGGIDEIRVFRIGDSSNMFQDWRFYVYNRYPSTFRFIKSSGSDKIRITRHPGDNDEVEEMVLDKIGLYRLYLSISDSNISNIHIGKSGDSVKLYFARVNVSNNNIVTSVEKGEEIIEEREEYQLISLGGGEAPKIVYFWYEGGIKKVNADSFLTFSYTEQGGKENQKSIVLSQNTGGAFPNEKYLEGFLDVVHYTDDQKTTKIPSGADLLPIYRKDIGPRNIAIPVVTDSSYNQTLGSIEIIQGKKYPYKFRYGKAAIDSGLEDVDFLDIFDEDEEVSINFPPGNPAPGQESIDDENNSLYVLDSFYGITRSIQVKNEYKNKRDGKRFVYKLDFSRPASNDSISFHLCYYQPVVVLDSDHPDRNNIYISCLSELSGSNENYFYPISNGESIENSQIPRYLDNEDDAGTVYPAFESGIDTKAFEIVKPNYVHTGNSSNMESYYPYFTYSLSLPPYPSSNSSNTSLVDPQVVWVTYSKTDSNNSSVSIENSELSEFIEIQTQKFYSNITSTDISSFLSNCDFLEIGKTYNIKFVYWAYDSGKTYYNYDTYKWSNGKKVARYDSFGGERRYYGALTWYSDFDGSGSSLSWREEEIFKVFTTPLNNETSLSPNSSNRFFIQSRSNIAGANLSNLDNMNGKNYVGLAALLMNLYIWDNDYFSFSDEMNEYWSTYIYPNNTWKLLNHTASKWFPIYQKVEGGYKDTILSIPAFPEENKSYLEVEIPSRIFLMGNTHEIRIGVDCKDSVISLLNGGNTSNQLSYNSGNWSKKGNIYVKNIVKKIEYGMGPTKSSASWKTKTVEDSNPIVIDLTSSEAFGANATISNVYLKFYFTDIEETIFGEIEQIYTGTLNNTVDSLYINGDSASDQNGLLFMRCTNSSNGLLIGNSMINISEGPTRPNTPGYSVNCVLSGVDIEIGIDITGTDRHEISIEHLGTQFLPYFPIGYAFADVYDHGSSTGTITYPETVAYNFEQVPGRGDIASSLSAYAIIPGSKYNQDYHLTTAWGDGTISGMSNTYRMIPMFYINGQARWVTCDINYFTYIYEGLNEHGQDSMPPDGVDYYLLYNEYNNSYLHKPDEGSGRTYFCSEHQDFLNKENNIINYSIQTGGSFRIIEKKGGNTTRLLSGTIT